MAPEVHIFRDRKSGFTLKDAIKYVSSFTLGEFGCLWLYHENGTQLAIMVNGRQAYPHFFPAGDHPGWQIAVPEDANWDTDIDFRADNQEPTPMPSALVVSVERAIKVLEYYWGHGQPTKEERWTSLVAGEP
jgi:hypothetical protein